MFETEKFQTECWEGKEENYKQLMGDSLDAILELKIDVIQGAAGVQNMQKQPIHFAQKEKVLSQEFYDPVAVYMEDFNHLKFQPSFHFENQIEDEMFFFLFKLLFC